jgi:hypothetical protein
MPQLVKGGKYVFGWSTVEDNGKIMIPPEAFSEYQFTSYSTGILMPGSKTSGGFGLTTLEALRDSSLSGILEQCPELATFQTSEGEAVECRGGMYCWITLRGNSFIVPIETLEHYGVHPGNTLLVVRGSGLALGFITRGPIIEEARKHPEIEKFQ